MYGYVQGKDYERNQVALTLTGCRQLWIRYDNTRYHRRYKIAGEHNHKGSRAKLSMQKQRQSAAEKGEYLFFSALL
jgi:hypothetical protein